MKLYPAIDLRGGQAVRLYQGDYDQMTVYNADPAAQAGCLSRSAAASVTKPALNSIFPSAWGAASWAPLP